MKLSERQEISSLPKKYKPLGAWAFWGYSVLFSIPVIGFIFLIIFSFSDSNISRRNFARSFFCVYALVLIICTAIILTGFGAALVRSLYSLL